MERANDLGGNIAGMPPSANLTSGGFIGLVVSSWPAEIHLKK
jgi:hypothetical protein